MKSHLLSLKWEIYRNKKQELETIRDQVIYKNRCCLNWVVLMLVKSIFKRYRSLIAK